MMAMMMETIETTMMMMTVMTMAILIRGRTWAAEAVLFQHGDDDSDDGDNYDDDDDSGRATGVSGAPRHI